MAKVTKIEVGRTISVKVAEYQYEKPYMSLTVELEDGDNYEEVLSELKEKLDYEMEIIRDEIS